MKNTDLRSIFQRELMPDLFLNNQDVFYNAFNEGTEAVENLIMELWAFLCNQNGDHVNNHPIDIDIKYIVLDESEDNFTCLMIMELPNIKKVKNLALYFGVFFGVNHDLRFFLGETDYQALGNNRYIFVIELILGAEDVFIRNNHGALYRGCNNEPFLFEKPENPRSPDVLIGIDPEDEWQAFTDRVAQVCLLAEAD